MNRDMVNSLKSFGIMKRDMVGRFVNVSKNLKNEMSADIIIDLGVIEEWTCGMDMHSIAVKCFDLDQIDIEYYEVENLNG